MTGEWLEDASHPASRRSFAVASRDATTWPGNAGIWMTFFFISLFVVLVFWRPQDWLVPWLFGWPLLDVIFVIALATFIIEVQYGRLKLPRNIPHFYLLAGLFVAAVMSHVANTYFQGMMDTIPEVFNICFFTVIFICVLDTPGKLRGITWMIVAMSCLMAVHALMQVRLGQGFAGQEPLFVPGTETKMPYVRAWFFGIFADPNDMAQMLATSIPLAFAMPRRRSLLGLLLSCGITYLLVLAILATGSRGGLVALAGGAAVMIALILPARWLPSALIVIIVAALFLCPFSGNVLDAAARDRVVFWGQANYIFRDNPVFGIGHNMFWMVANSRAAHNSFVLCYTELGVFGYYFWFSLLVMSFVGAWRVKAMLRGYTGADEAWLRRFVGLCLAALMGYSASGYFLSRTFMYPLFFLFGIMAASTAVALRCLPADHPPVFNFRKDLAVIAPLATLVSIAYVYISILFLNKAFGG